MSRAIFQQGARALARHEVVDLARAAIILMLTVAAALFVPRSLFATTPSAAQSTQASAHTGK